MDFEIAKREILASLDETLSENLNHKTYQKVMGDIQLLIECYKKEIYEQGHGSDNNGN